ncbi:MAG: T9SS type A sorting domain-containing protein [Bacteroidota bacterium]|nr:T9SS type A sorting domain-containing protein [Bacteroidota bacterium]
MKNTIKHLALILLCSFCSLTVSAQNLWNPLNGPSGGPVYDIITGSTSFDFCITPAGIFRTSNNGDMWTQSSPVTIKNLYVGSADNQGNIFAATTNYTTLLYRSSDNGNTWQQRLDGGLDFNAVAASPNGTIFAGTFYMFSFHGQFIQDGDIFRSTDNGETWSAVNFPSLAINALKVNSNGEVFAATTEGLFKSANNGASFGLIRNGSTGSIFINSQNHIFIQSLNSILRSTDNGSSWISIGSGNEIKMPIAQDGVGNLYTGYLGKLYKSIDNGTSWNLFADFSGNSYHEVSSIRFKSGGMIIVSTSKGIFRSDNNGVSWIKANNGIRDPQVRSIAVKNNTIFTASYNSVSRSTDNGHSWIELNNGLPSFLSAREIITGSSLNVFTNIPGSGLYRSVNNGNSWFPVQSLPPNISQLKAGAGNKIFITTENSSVFKSDDNGNNWSNITSNLPDSILFSGLSLDEQNNLYVSFQRFSWFNPLKGISKSTDEGITWNELNTEIAPEDMIINSQGIFFAKFGSALFKSINGGSNFAQITSEQEYVIEYTIGTSDQIFMHSANDKIYKISKSVDNGQTWTEHTGILENQLIYDLKFDDNSQLLAATQSGLYRLESPTIVTQTGNNLPAKFLLIQNYPNPFNPNTIINYELGITNYVTLKIYDALGKVVSTLVNQKQNAGTYKVEFDGASFSSGVYFYRLDAGNFSDTKRMVLIK